MVTYLVYALLLYINISCLVNVLINISNILNKSAFNLISKCSATLKINCLKISVQLVALHMILQSFVSYFFIVYLDTKKMILNIDDTMTKCTVCGNSKRRKRIGEKTAETFLFSKAEIYWTSRAESIKHGDLFSNAKFCIFLSLYIPIPYEMIPRIDDTITKCTVCGNSKRRKRTWGKNC